VNLSTNPKSIKSREWYALHKSQPSLRQKANQTRIKLRDSESFRNTRAEIMARYRRDPVQSRKMALLNKEWAANNPEKLEAYRIVHNALRRGELVRPTLCTRCVRNPGKARDGRSLLHAHHVNYSKPLEVEWLCSVCHGAERRKT
jgi:hypothetical protein